MQESGVGCTAVLRMGPADQAISGVLNRGLANPDPNPLQEARAPPDALDDRGGAHAFRLECNFNHLVAHLE